MEKVLLKCRLHSSSKQLSGLRTKVEESLRKRSPLSPREYETLVELSQTHDLDGQLRALDDAEAQIEKELVAVWSGLAQEDYIHFYEFLNRNETNLDGTIGFTASPHQRLIGDLLMRAEAGDLMRCIISMPPGHCKSTHCTHHFPAWYFGRNLRRRYLQAGHSQNFVENEMGARVRGIINGEDYHTVFPDVRIRADMKAKAYWGLTNMKGQYVGLGVGQGISGFRGDFGAVDDPYKSRQDAESQTTRDKVFKWYSDDFSARLLPWAPLFIVSTRWHSDDVCGRIEDDQRKKDEESSDEASKRIEYAEELAAHLADAKMEDRFRWEIINLPAMAEEDDVLGRQPGEPLWPELFDLSDLLRRKANMESGSWNSLYQGTPMDVEGGTISASWFKRYDKLPDRKKEVRKCVLSIDAANVAKERSDYSVILVWMQDEHKNHYLADVYRKRLEFTALSSLIEQVAKQWEADAILVEAKGNGLSYIQSFTGTAKAPAPIIPIEVGQSSKEFRFDKVSPMIEGGAVYLPSRAVWLPDYEKELIAFPNGKFDDQVDATSQYLDWARNKGRRGTRKLGGTAHH